MTINEIARAVAVWQLLASDTKLSSYVTSPDMAVFKRRAGAEGMKFLTVTLPSLGKALDRSMETGVFELPEGWRPAKDCAYPAFLSTCWAELFEKDGRARWALHGGAGGPPPVIWNDLGAVVACVRQLTFCFYKYEQPWTDEQAEATYSAFKSAEKEVAVRTRELLDGAANELVGDTGLTLDCYLSRAEALITRLLEGTDPFNISPKYGSGATACRSTPEGRWQSARFIPRLDAVYPYCEWFVSGLNGLDSLLRGSVLQVDEEPNPGARVALVPKDSRGPRLISCEPREFMYIQQGLMSLLYDVLERYPHVRSQVSCTDQTRNQLLALIGSQVGGLATLDLKEASDRVSWWLVIRLFPGNWVKAFQSCRSEYTVLPDGEEVPLLKFAPMGSACCFPVEAIVFWALCNAAKTTWTPGLAKALVSRSSRVDKRAFPTVWGVNDVCVYGDDIIVPTSEVDTVVQVLSAVGLQVNTTKSFRYGPFRESCGKDYFAGYDCAPVRVRSLLGGMELETLFRFNDLCNNILLKYSQGNPTLVYKIRELYQEFFGFAPPVMNIGPAERWGYDNIGVSGLYLKDAGLNVRMDGETLVRDKRTGSWCVGEVRLRRSVPGRLKNDYNGLQMRVLTETPLQESHDLGWCSVLRSSLVSGGRGGTDKYAIRGRVRHKTAWTYV